MNIGELINSEVKEQLKEAASLSHQKKEQLSRRDIEELMDISRPTYTKVKGRVRQK